MKEKRTALLAAAAFFVFLLFMLSGCSADYDFTDAPAKESPASPAMRSITDPGAEIRGVWIASVYNIDFPSAPDLDGARLRGEIDAILDTCEKNGLNTVFFQVRPACDALYESSLYPVSKSMSSDGILQFDPLEYFLEAGHQRNIKIHAWVNPLRVTLSGTDISALPDGSPAAEHPEWTVAYGGRLCFNAGIPEVRDFIAEGIREIVAKYDVDGVVFDDYFYPYPAYGSDGKLLEFDDGREFKLYGGDFDDVGDWRRENVNLMVKACFEAVRETDPECIFGISPFGVWQNDDGENGGSRTRNFEAYKSLYCDALAWIEGGYIDYICPQIYWSTSSTTSPFGVVADWWNAQLDGTDVTLLVAHGSYLYEDGEWSSPEGEMTEEVAYARQEKSYRGSVFYGYDEVNRNIHGISDEISEFFGYEVIYSDTLSNGSGVEISYPADGEKVAKDEITVTGTSDPYYALTLNGKKVGRTKNGEFSVTVRLEKGENKMVFVQNGEEYVFTVERSD